MDNIREAFENEYAKYNTLIRRPDGKYQDWNIELTWYCWKRAWEKAIESQNAKKEGRGGNMPKGEYLVSWKIDINANSPREAAETALKIMACPRDALVFQVDGEEIDLAIHEEVEDE